MEELMAKEEIRINLSAIRRIEPNVEKILSRAKQVALYDFNTTNEEWKLTEVIGVLFVCKRKIEPYYSIIIMNRQNDKNFIKPITKQLEWQFIPPFLLYQSCLRIQGIWFSNQDECDCVTTLVTQIVECMQVIEEDQSKQDEIDKKMLTIVTKAQEDYFKSVLACRPLPDDSKQPHSVEKSSRNPSTPVNISGRDKNASSVPKTVENDLSTSKTVCSNPKPSGTTPVYTTPSKTSSPMYQGGVSTITVPIQRSRQRRARGMRSNSKYLNDNSPLFAAPASADHSVKATIKTPSPFKKCIEDSWMSSTPPCDKFTSRGSNKSDKSPLSSRTLDEAESKRSENITQIKLVESVTSNVINDDNIKTKQSRSRTSFSRRLNYAAASIGYHSPSNQSTDTDNDVTEPLTTLVFNNTKHLENEYPTLPSELKQTEDTTQIQPNYRVRRSAARRLIFMSKTQSKGKGSGSEPSTSNVFNNSKHSENNNPTVHSELTQAEDTTQIKLNYRERRAAARRLRYFSQKQRKGEDSDSQPLTIEMLNTTKHLENGCSNVPSELKRTKDITQLKVNESPTSNVGNDDKNKSVKPKLSYLRPFMSAEHKDYLISTTRPSSSKQSQDKAIFDRPSTSLGLCKPEHAENSYRTASSDLKRSENKTLFTQKTSATLNVGNDDKNKSKIILLRPSTFTSQKDDPTFTVRSSPSKKNKDKSIHCRPSTSLGLSNPKYFEKSYPTASSSPNNLPHYHAGSIKENVMKTGTKEKDSRPSTSLGFTNLKDIENNYSINATSSTPNIISDNRPKSIKKPIPNVTSKFAQLNLLDLCLDNIKEFIPRNVPTPTSTKIPDFPPGSIKEYFTKLRRKGKNNYSLQNIPTKLPNYPPENIKDYFSKINSRGNDSFLNTDPYTPTTLPDYRPTIKEFFSKGTPESHLFKQCRRLKNIGEEGKQLAVPLKDDADESATLKQKGKDLRKYISSHTLEEVQTRSDTPIPFQFTKPSTTKSPNLQTRMLPSIAEENQNGSTEHILQTLQYLIETDRTVLSKIHDAYGKSLDQNLQYK